MKKIYLIFAFLGVVLSLSSCFKTPERIYTGPLVVEFKNHRAGFTTANNTAILNVSNTVTARTVRQAIGTDTIYVQLVGPQSAQAVEVSYQVVGTSTAVENTHYRFPTTRGTLTIPANSSVGYLLIQTLPAITSATEIRSVVFTLLNGSNNVGVSENYKTFTFNIRQ
jgi:hypothetical protein